MEPKAQSESSVSQEVLDSLIKTDPKLQTKCIVFANSMPLSLITHKKLKSWDIVYYKKPPSSSNDEPQVSLINFLLV